MQLLILNAIYQLVCSDSLSRPNLWSVIIFTYAHNTWINTLMPVVLFEKLVKICVSADRDSFRQNWIISLFKSFHTTIKPFNSRIIRHSKKSSNSMPLLFVYLYKNGTMQKVNSKISVITPLCVGLYQFTSSTKQSRLPKSKQFDYNLYHTRKQNSELPMCFNSTVFVYKRKIDIYKQLETLFFSKCKYNNLLKTKFRLNNK